jgi:hypothetical protein
MDCTTGERLIQQMRLGIPRKFLEQIPASFYVIAIIGPGIICVTIQEADL